MKRLWIIAFVFAIVVCAGCGEEAEEKIRIGGIFPITGGSATFGKSSREGMQIAVDEFNEKGGIAINGKKVLVEPIYDDTAGQPEQASYAARKQIDQDQVQLQVAGFQLGDLQDLLDLPAQA